MSLAEQPETRNVAYYCKRFSELKVSRSRQRGEAHYKPILLLSVIDLIAQGLITENQIPVSDALIETFNKYWGILGSGSYKGGLYYPFYHLSNDNIGWELTFNPDFDGPQPKTTNKLREAVNYAKVDNSLFELLQDPITRSILIDCLLASWFSANRRPIEDILEINQEFQKNTQEEIQAVGADENLDTQPRVVFRKSTIRNAFFRKSVVHIYDYKCVFCRLRVTRTLNQNIVDGAHIMPFAQFFDSRINNGLSLCKNHHWAFDQGWFAVDNDYKLIVANDLEEESPNAKPMKDFHGEIILLPSSEQYFPRLDALEWHRLNVFRA